MSKTDGLIIMWCSYCEKLIGYIDFKPTLDSLNLVDTQPCCIDCFKKRED